jgi:hypothetical protein
MKRVLRLPELIDLATDPEVVAKMVAKLGPEMTRQVLLLLKAKAEALDPDEIDLDDRRRL